MLIKGYRVMPQRILKESKSWVEEGNSSEAGVVFGVENSKDPGVSEAITQKVPEDDVPGEYINQY